MANYLHQIIAVERGAEAEAKSELDKVRLLLSVGGDRNPLTGLSRTHEPRTDADVRQPAEERRVQLTTTALLDHAAQSLARFMDVKFTREYGNTAARADVTVDGQPLLTDVPAGYLLFLESQLASLITGLIEKLQVRDPAEEWNPSPEAGHGVFASVPRNTLSTTKRPEKQELAPPDAHGNAAQVRWYDADVVTGTWTWIKYSGQLSMAEVQAIRDRAVKLLNAVKQAREQANRLEVTSREAGAAVLGYVFGDLLG